MVHLTFLPLPHHMAQHNLIPQVTNRSLLRGARVFLTFFIFQHSDDVVSRTHFDDVYSVADEHLPSRWLNSRLTIVTDNSYLLDTSKTSRRQLLFWYLKFLFLRVDSSVIKDVMILMNKFLALLEVRQHLIF